MRIWGDPPAGGPLLQLLTAQAGWWNSPNSYLQNLANDGTPNSVFLFTRIRTGNAADFLASLSFLKMCDRVEPVRSFVRCRRVFTRDQPQSSRVSLTVGTNQTPGYPLARNECFRTCDQPPPATQLRGYMSAKK